jgi:crossover junction endodeoxyribonuclease RuvC
VVAQARSFSGGGNVPGEEVILGLDVSLTATGIDDGDGPRVLHTDLVGVERLAWYSGRLTLICRAKAPDLAIIEGYSYASANQAHQMGELGGVVRLILANLGIPTVIVAPSTLKKWLTGKGTAGKDDMVATAARLGCPVNNNNAVDSWALRQMGLYHLGRAAIPATGYRDEIVAKVTWPELRGVA